MASRPFRRVPLLIACHVVAGRPWIARHISNTTLRKFCRDFGKTFQKSKYNPSDELRSATLEVLREIEGRSYILHRPDAHRRTVTAIIRIASTRRHWIRDPRTWQPDHEVSSLEQLQSFISHLFEKSALPVFWQNVWFSAGPLLNLERRYYLDFAKNQNLTFQNESGYSWVSLTRKEAAILAQTAPETPLLQAFREAQLRACGWGASISEILASPIGIDFRNDHIWLPLLQMARSLKRPSDELVLVAESLQDEIEIRYPSRIRLKGRTWDSLKKSADATFSRLKKWTETWNWEVSAEELLNPATRARIREFSKRSWEPLAGVNAWEHQRNQDRWQIVELCSHLELRREGQAQKHCVETYSRYCLKGYSNIFSLRLWDAREWLWDPYVTIEVARRSRCIWQAKAISNAPLNGVERSIVQKWAEQFEIKF